MAVQHLCDICGQPIKSLSFTDYVSLKYKMKKEWWGWEFDHGWTKVEAHKDCLEELCKAIEQKRKEVLD